MAAVGLLSMRSDLTIWPPLAKAMVSAPLMSVRCTMTLLYDAYMWATPQRVLLLIVFLVFVYLVCVGVCCVFIVVFVVRLTFVFQGVFCRVACFFGCFVGVGLRSFWMIVVGVRAVVVKCDCWFFLDGDEVSWAGDAFSVDSDMPVTDELPGL